MALSQTSGSFKMQVRKTVRAGYDGREEQPMNSPTQQYLSRCTEMLATVAAQEAEIARAADLMAAAILAGRMVHVFGAGHSRIAVEEMWPRYGSFPGFNPIVELSLTFHNLVVGANGQRQAMFLENVSGLAARILRNFELSPQDAALVISSSGCNTVPIEMAEQFQNRGIPVVAIISRRHSRGQRQQSSEREEIDRLRGSRARHRSSNRRRASEDRRLGNAGFARFDHRQLPADQRDQSRSGPALTRGERRHWC